MNIGELTATLGVDVKGLLTAQRQFDAFGKKATTTLSRVADKMFSLKTAIAGLVGTYGLSRLARSFIGVASETENYRLRLVALLGSVEEGNRAFEEMAKFAGQVPFEYREIMGAATTLAGVMKGGVDEIEKWMPMIADLAAATGLGLEMTLSNFVKMYSAGASAADAFRERGILAMMGFKTGVHYTVEETRKMMWEAWTKVGSKFRGLTSDMEKTWTGLNSMLAD